MGKIRRRPEPEQFIIREIESVPLTFLNDAGEPVKEKFAIKVKSFTEYGMLGLTAALKPEVLPNGILPHSAVFAQTVVAIIDSDNEPLTDEQGEPAVLTREFFAGMLPEDLEAISEAIRADANPPRKSPSPGDSGSRIQSEA